MKNYVFSFLILLIAIKSYTQEEKIDKIRTIYSEIQKKIKDTETTEEKFVFPRFEIKTEKMRRAIGLVTYTTTIYFDVFDDIKTEGDKEEMVYEETIRFVTSAESAGGYKVYEEYLYNATGNLIFYYCKTTKYGCGETRCYFENGKLIKIKVNPLPLDEYSYEAPNPDDCNFSHLAKELTKTDLEQGRIIYNQGEEYKAIFKNISRF